MNPIPWYESAIIRQQIAQLISAALVFFGVTSEQFNVDETVAAIFAGVGALIATWTIITRLFKPHPPITETSQQKTTALIRKQGGHARPLMLALLLVVSIPLAAVSTGCTGTRSAYREVQSPAEFAYVVAEHYASLVREAANLKDKSSTPRDLVEKMQRAELTARPLVMALQPLSQAYLASRSATTEAQLQAAIDSAVLAIADLVRSVNAARGAK